MTIETIKKRSNHIDQKYKASCTNCGSEFEALEKDLSFSVYRRTPYQVISINQPEAINCPECEK